MILGTLKTIFNRDFLKLKQELEFYKDQRKIWQVEEGISNSAGNLCLHLIGNINHFIGATLGGTTYVRNRELEFSQKDIPVNELLKHIDDTMLVVENTLNNLSEDKLAKEFPLLYSNQKVTTMFILLQLVAHLDYHLGQINYLRRLLDK